jgi:DNA-binding HxlR family transcriptional regulator
MMTSTHFQRGTQGELADMIGDLRKAGAIELLVSLEQPKRFMEILWELHLSTSTLSRRLNEFMQKGLVITEYDPTTKTIRYKLTEKGQRYLEVIKNLRSTPESEFAAKLASTKSYEEGVEIIVDEVVKKVSKELNLNISEEEVRKIAEKIKKELKSYGTVPRTV